MIRLLIVDDEATERIALQRIIEDGVPGVEVVGHAANGREAIETAERLRPDLITMDIKMPGIDGLQATEKIKETNDTAKFIIVTAFDTFEFARQAIKLGVSDYMLKPSRTSVVVETIAKVAGEIRQAQAERERRSMERKRLERMVPIVEADMVSQLLFDYVPSTDLNEMIELWGLPAERGSFVMNAVVSQAKEEEQLGELEDLYMRFIRHMDGANVQCWIGKMSGRQVPLIVFVDGELSYRNYAISLGRRLIQALGKMSGCTPFIGIGGLCTEVGELRRSYHEAILASADCSPPSRLCLYEDLVRQESEAAGSLTIDMEKTVLEEVRLGNWSTAGDIVGQMIDVYEGAGQSVGMAQQRVFEVLIIASRTLQEMGIEAVKPYYPHQTASYTQLKAETRILLGHLAEAAAALAGEMESDLLASMKMYIKEHAHEDLSLERIAAMVNRNPFYISKLFKDYFGMNYIDYLTECRMETAKQLMQETDKSLKEITYEIGYRDPNYFSRVFKKIAGHSPTDYRKMLLRRANKKQ